MLDTPAAPTWAGPASSDYERALWQSLSGPAEPVTLLGETGLVLRLEVGRYAGRADPADRALLEHCTGPTLDIGCGPGRLAAELAGRGVPALGVDVTPVALLLARASGATVLGRSVFDRLPAEGRWPHALLIDGNIGISGDPRALLERVKELLLPTGATLTVETTPKRPTSGIGCARTAPTHAPVRRSPGRASARAHCARWPNRSATVPRTTGCSATGGSCSCPPESAH